MFAAEFCHNELRKFVGSVLSPNTILVTASFLTIRLITVVPITGTPILPYQFINGTELFSTVKYNNLSLTSSRSIDELLWFENISLLAPRLAPAMESNRALCFPPFYVPFIWTTSTYNWRIVEAAATLATIMSVLWDMLVTLYWWQSCPWRAYKP